MENTAVQKISEIIDKNEAIDIVIGKNPHLDEMAAALSLYLSLQASGKKVSIASPTNPIVEISSLVGINKVQTSLSGKQGSDLVVSFPYKDKEIQKVSYTLEEGYLNIVVKAGPSGLSFSDKDVVFKRGGGGQASGILFVVGTARLSDLGNLFDPEALKDTTVVNIDNKQHNQGFGDIIFVSSKYSSVSEQVAYLLKQLNLQVDVDTAQNLLSGISQVTDNFQKPSTSMHAFEMAAFLMRKGAQREKTSGRLQPVHQSQIPQRQFNQNARDAQSPFAVPVPAPRPMRPNSNFPQKPAPSFLDNFDEEETSQDNAFFGPSQSQNQPAPKKDDTQPKVDKAAPSDWLTPKIYKGSSEV